MLIEFSVGNFLSFKDQVTFSMVASNIKEHQKNTFEKSNLNLLKSAVIYGANASGKSNLFKALSFMFKFVKNSSKDTQVDEEIDVSPFLLSKETEDKPCFFEVVFLINDIRYRYGFEATQERIHKEWFFRALSSKEAKLFTRVDENIELGSYFKEGKGLEERTRSNALFLSVVSQFNGKVSQHVMNWMTKVNILSSGNRSNTALTTRKLRDTEFKEKVLELMKVADLGIEDISIEDIEPDDISFPEEIPENIREILSSKEITVVLTHHKKYDKNNEFNGLESFSLRHNESDGTIKFFALAAPILDALINGKTLVIDELDAKLHPLLTRYIINLFNSNDSNKNNAQLIFSTHDTNHLNKKYFRRDQIWFIEKDRYGCSDLYSLVEYDLDERKVRSDASFEKDYIKGKYGAIPYIGNLEFLEG